MQSVITRFEELLQSDDFRTIRDQVGSLRSEFMRKLDEQNMKLRKEYIREGGDPEGFKAPKDPLEEKLESLFAIYNEKKEVYRQEREVIRAQQEEARKKREEADKQRIANQKTYLAELKEVVSTGKIDGEALQKVRDLQASWKSNGRSDKPESKEIQLDFSHQVDLFFHNRKIANDLRDLDYNRNLEVKEEILVNMKGLMEEESIDKLANQMRKYQADWNAAGQVPWEKKDDVYARFKEMADHIYGRIQGYYDDRRELSQENLTKKQALIEEAKGINSAEFTSHKQWQEHTEKVIKLQATWKEVGYSEKNEEVWQEFRTTCDQFFEDKKNFYNNLDASREDNRIKKEGFCIQAEEMMHERDWKKTTDQFIKLQKDWKNTGSAPREDENKLWARFREACDTFFNAKREFFGDQDEAHGENLKLKEALIARVEAMELSGDTEQDFQTLRTIGDEWSGIGHVPIKEKDRIYKSYYKAIDEKYDKLKVGRSERQALQYKDRLDNLMESADAENLLRRERQKLNKVIDAKRNELTQYENNLGFFSASKNGKENPLVKEVENNIEKLRNEIQDLRKKLNAIPTQVVKE